MASVVDTANLVMVGELLLSVAPLCAMLIIFVVAGMPSKYGKDD